ncbi:MAG TPA: hypothetical protein PLA74_04425 [Syntrophales bacterium]|nr:hypothetical protein [Syntrophales bacterium]HPQ45145.1 hypothetical protein [Syntrophales bacterium]
MKANLSALPRDQILRCRGRHAGGVQFKGDPHRIHARECDPPSHAVGLGLCSPDFGKDDGPLPLDRNGCAWIAYNLPVHEIGYGTCHSESKICIPKDTTTLDGPLIKGSDGAGGREDIVWN